MKYNINLLTKKELGFWDKSVYFALNYLRYILVVTQLVVIGVLFYRFKIDNNIVELKESISQKQEIVRVTKPLVDQADKLDVQVSSINSSIESQNLLKDSLAYLTTVFPEKISLSELTIQGSVYSFKGTASDAEIVQAFYNRLLRDHKFASVTLENVKKGGEGSVSFSMSLTGFKL